MTKSVWLPIALFVLLAPFTPTLDHFFSEAFYDPAIGFSQHPTFQWIYRWAPYPAWIVAILGIICLVFSRYRPVSPRLTHAAAVLTITMVLGSGILTNALLKSYWGRPRPIQVEEYGGGIPYRAFYEPNFAQTLCGKDRCRSFPSGHASTGFLFFALVPIGWRFRNRTLVVSGFLVGGLLGGVLSLARIAEGGHFFSDCVTSALLMWLVALWVDRMVGRKNL
jgi:membrane-associated PAP2 superfamily phosphatase